MKIQILTDDVNVSEDLSAMLSSDAKAKPGEIAILRAEKKLTPDQIDKGVDFLILLFLHSDHYPLAFQLGKKIAATIRLPYIFISPPLSDTHFNQLLLSGPDYHLNYPMETRDIKRVMAFIKTKTLPKISAQPATPVNGTKLWLTLKKGEYEGVRISDIVMVRASDHYLVMKVKDRPKPIIFKGTLTRFFQEELSVHSFFFMLSRSYIINLRLVFRISDNQVFVGEERLAIPKQRKEELIKVLFKH